MKLSVLNFLAIALFLFSSCEKGADVDKVSDEKDDTEIKDDGEKDDWGDKDKKDCFELVYPVTYTMPDGSEISGGPEELEAAIKEWYETHDSAEKPVLNYPVEIAFPDHDEAKTINNEEEMEVAKKECEDDWDGKGHDKDCFKFVYPISYTMPDGSTISGGPEELEAAIKEWYETHDSVEEATLVFPIQIVFPDNDTPVTINNEEELNAAKEDC